MCISFLCNNMMNAWINDVSECDNCDNFVITDRHFLCKLIICCYSWFIYTNDMSCVIKLYTSVIFHALHRPYCTSDTIFFTDLNINIALNGHPLCVYKEATTIIYTCRWNGLCNKLVKTFMIFGTNCTLSVYTEKQPLLLVHVFPSQLSLMF